MRVIVLGAILVLLATNLPPLASAGATPSAQSEATLTVLSGWGPPTMVVEEFLPAKLTVGEGTTVTWLQDTLREHTVTFLAGTPLPLENIPQPEDPSLPVMRNPLAEYPTPPAGPWDGTTFINSGRMQQGETFSVTFTTAGSYPFVCIPHAAREGMVGTVTVVPAGSPGITTQEEVDVYLAEQAALFERQFDEILATRDAPTRYENADGTTTWILRNGTDQRQESDFMRGRLTLRRYLPNRLTIRPGDTVVWHTNTRVPVHTVTFPVQDAPPPARWVARLADGAPVPFEQLSEHGTYRSGNPGSLDFPRIIDTPNLLEQERPGPVYDPTKLFNSGEMGDNAHGRAFSLQFTTPGTFVYFCVPHTNLGQVGEITVASL